MPLSRRAEDRRLPSSYLSLEAQAILFVALFLFFFFFFLFIRRFLAIQAAGMRP